MKASCRFKDTERPAPTTAKAACPNAQHTVRIACIFCTEHGESKIYTVRRTWITAARRMPGSTQYWIPISASQRPTLYGRALLFVFIENITPIVMSHERGIAPLD
jgi:hypothetical protein